MKHLTLITLMLLCNSAFANDYFRSRTIIGAGIYSSGGKSILFVDIDGDKTAMSSCATTKRFSVSSTDPSYKELVSIALTAYASAQSSVDLVVSSTCNHWGNAQDLRGIKMGKMPW